jgi:DNA-binding CsgD family transcriptional regulator
LSPGKTISGYLQVSLCKDGVPEKVLVHRLVAEAFFGPAPSPDHEVNHRNGDKNINTTENLEWVTRRENLRHAREELGVKMTNVRPRGEQQGHSVLTRRDVERIRELYASGEHIQAELAEMFGVSKSAISLVVRGENWRHVGGPISNIPARGEACYNAKLTRDDVVEIRRLYATGGYSYREIGEMFGISPVSAFDVVRRRTWKHVP